MIFTATQIFACAAGPLWSTPHQTAILGAFPNCEAGLKKCTQKPSRPLFRTGLSPHAMPLGIILLLLHEQHLKAASPRLRESCRNGRPTTICDQC